ncbi:MAG: hypothetical protein KBG15_23475, partial [Kofleriaceae bacterium]|nr:hypothetical protein [Kofleriaceae bacterium]
MHKTSFHRWAQTLVASVAASCGAANQQGTVKLNDNQTHSEAQAGASSKQVGTSAVLDLVATPAVNDIHPDAPWRFVSVAEVAAALWPQSNEVKDLFVRKTFRDFSSVYGVAPVPSATELYRLDNELELALVNGDGRLLPVTMAGVNNALARFQKATAPSPRRSLVEAAVQAIIAHQIFVGGVWIHQSGKTSVRVPVDIAGPSTGSVPYVQAPVLPPEQASIRAAVLQHHRDTGVVPVGGGHGGQLMVMPLTVGWAVVQRIEPSGGCSEGAQMGLLVSVVVGGKVQTVEQQKARPGHCRGRLTDGMQVPDAAIADCNSFFAHAESLEAASVFAFLRLANELEYWGAPADLIERAQTAAQDEVRHAGKMRSLQYPSDGNPPLEANSNATPLPAPRSLLDIAIENAVSGCVFEAFAAVVALWQASTAPMFQD